MKMTTMYLWVSVLSILIGCGKSNDPENAKDEFYFKYSIDGKAVSLTADDIMTSYNKFNDHVEFKIFAGKDEGPQLVLTMVSDMSKPSSTPNGSETYAKGFLNNGSVSLQDYPSDKYTFNSYDYSLNPKPAIIADAIVITSSEPDGDIARILTGSINTIVRGGPNPAPADPNIKDYVIKGTFRIRHLFNGVKF